MRAWVAGRLRALRAWLLVRLGLWRGQWRRGWVSVAAVPFAVGPFAVHDWHYGLYAPPGLADDEAAPLIVVLHGCKQRAMRFAYAAGLTELSDRMRARLLCPQQRRRANLFFCWNWFVPLAQAGAGELRVILAMLDDATGQVRTDPESIAAVGISAGGALAALLAFHSPDRIRAAAVVAAPPLLGSFNVQNPQAVMRSGLLFAPELALGLSQRPFAPLAIIQGTADEIVHPSCAAQLQAQVLESLHRAGVDVAREEGAQFATAAVVDYRSEGRVRLRRIDVPGLGHEWTGGPGGHPYCAAGGAPLAALCGEFLRDAGALRGKLRDRSGKGTEAASRRDDRADGAG